MKNKFNLGSIERHSEMRSAMLQALVAVGLVLVVAPLASVAADSDSLAMADLSKVTCGSTIKLTHTATKARLHSHDIS